MRTGAILIVIPRSRSSGIRSRYCACIERIGTVPVISSRRSASVDFPLSICAMMTKLRICSIAVILQKITRNHKEDRYGFTMFSSARMRES